MNHQTRLKVICLAGAFVTLANTAVYSSVIDTPDDSLMNIRSTVNNVSIVSTDTIIYQPGDVLHGYTPAADTVNVESNLRQAPTLALLKSMIVPGWGQMGNGRYIKATVYFGLDVWFIGAAMHYGRQASDLRKQYDMAGSIALRNEYYSLFLDRKDERNKFTWFAVIISFISMFDAYTDAHLSGFPKRSERGRFSLDVTTNNDGSRLAVVRLRF